eukprot:481867-Prymnesium_polylepis.1
MEAEIADHMRTRFTYFHSEIQGGGRSVGNKTCSRFMSRCHSCESAPSIGNVTFERNAGKV